MITRKNKEKKQIQSYIKAKFNPTNSDIVENLKNSLQGQNFESKPKIAEISNTKFDEIILAEKKSRKPPEKYVTPLQVKTKLYLTESEKRRDLARRAM